MNDYIFYTLEGYTQSPNGNKVENCQVIGIASGADKQDALVHLLADNPWIAEHRFDSNKFLCRELSSCDNSSSIITYLTNLLDERQLEQYMQWLDGNYLERREGNKR